MATSDKVKCPDCGASLELAPKPGNPKRVVAVHNCCGRGSRQVYETDAKNYFPLEDRIQPSESQVFPFKGKKNPQ